MMNLTAVAGSSPRRRDASLALRLGIAGLCLVPGLTLFLSLLGWIDGKVVALGSLLHPTVFASTSVLGIIGVLIVVFSLDEVGQGSPEQDEAYRQQQQQAEARARAAAALAGVSWGRGPPSARLGGMLGGGGDIVARVFECLVPEPGRFCASRYGTVGAECFYSRKTEDGHGAWAMGDGHSKTLSRENQRWYNPNNPLQQCDMALLFDLGLVSRGWLRAGSNVILRLHVQAAPDARGGRTGAPATKRSNHDEDQSDIFWSRTAPDMVSESLGHVHSTSASAPAMRSGARGSPSLLSHNSGRQELYWEADVDREAAEFEALVRAGAMPRLRCSLGHDSYHGGECQSCYWESRPVMRRARATLMAQWVAMRAWRGMKHGELVIVSGAAMLAATDGRSGGSGSSSSSSGGGGGGASGLSRRRHGGRRRGEGRFIRDRGCEMLLVRSLLYSTYPLRWVNLVTSEVSLFGNLDRSLEALEPVAALTEKALSRKGGDGGGGGGGGVFGVTAQSHLEATYCCVRKPLKAIMAPRLLQQQQAPRSLHAPRGRRQQCSAADIDGFLAQRKLEDRFVTLISGALAFSRKLRRRPGKPPPPSSSSSPAAAFDFFLNGSEICLSSLDAIGKTSPNPLEPVVDIEELARIGLGCHAGMILGGQLRLFNNYYFHRVPVSVARRSWRQLTALNVSGNRLLAGGLEAVCLGLAASTARVSLTSLDLSGNRTPSSRCTRRDVGFCRALAGLPGLQSVGLSGNMIGAYFHLARSWATVGPLRDADANEDSDGPAGRWLKDLAGVGVLVNLLAGQGGFGHTRTTRQTSMMRDLPGLPLFEEGSDEALSSMRGGRPGQSPRLLRPRRPASRRGLGRLTALDLSHNHLSNAGAKLFASGLSVSATLRHLKLGHNRMAPSGLCAIARAVARSSEHALASGSVTNAGRVAAGSSPTIVGGAYQCRGLESLDVSGNVFCGGGTNVELQQPPGLARLEQITVASTVLRAFARTLRQAPQLCHLVLKPMAPIDSRCTGVSALRRVLRLRPNAPARMSMASRVAVLQIFRQRCLRQLYGGGGGGGGRGCSTNTKSRSSPRPREAVNSLASLVIGYYVPPRRVWLDSSEPLRPLKDGEEDLDGTLGRSRGGARDLSDDEDLLDYTDASSRTSCMDHPMAVLGSYCAAATAAIVLFAAIAICFLAVFAGDTTRYIAGPVRWWRRINLVA